MLPRFLLALLLGALALTLAACGGETGTDGGETETDGGETETDGETNPGVTDPGDTETGDGGAPAAGNAAAGEAVWNEGGCGGCHVLDAAGSEGQIGPNLDEAEPAFELVVERVTNGMGAMPAFKGDLSEEQIQNVAAYVVKSTGGG